MAVRGVRREDLPWRLRIRQAYSERKREIYEEPSATDDALTRALRWWFMPADQSTVEIAPTRALRKLFRHPRGTVSLPGTDWMPAALREDARLLRKLHREAELGHRPARVPGLPWTRGPMGVKIIENLEGKITFQTIANDLRAMADALDGLARVDRRDRERHD